VVDYFCSAFEKNHRGVAQLASVLAWGASGPPFESAYPDRLIEGADLLLPFILHFYVLHIHSLYSESLKKFYAGQTEDFNRRIVKHNNGKTPFMKWGCLGPSYFRKNLYPEAKQWHWKIKLKSKVHNDFF
jgi:hypothetical protein